VPSSGDNCKVNAVAILDAAHPILVHGTAGDGNSFASMTPIRDGEVIEYTRGLQ
jgi:hypothetical protein